MNIFITNDDGINSAGLIALAQAAHSLGSVYVIAPERNWSATGHVKSLNRPLRTRMEPLKNGIQAWSTDGSPSDCVTLAAHGYFGVKMDLVITGINTTANVAQDITCSGTVTAAMEAVIHGLPAIAFSLDTATGKNQQPAYEDAARWASRVISIASKQKFALQSLLSVNIPNLPFDEVKGIQITRLGQRIYHDRLEKREDPRGNPYYWIAGSEPTGVNQSGTDIGALAEGYVSVTPLHLDMTAYHLYQNVLAWDWEAREGMPLMEMHTLQSSHL